MDIDSSKKVIKQVIRDFERIEDLEDDVIFTSEFISKFSKYKDIHELSEAFVSFLGEAGECGYYGNGSWSYLLNFIGDYNLNDFIESYTFFMCWDDFYNAAVSYYFTKLLSSILLSDLSKINIDESELIFQLPVLCSWTDFLEDEDEEE